MTKIIYPTKGTIKVNGKLTSLLELGAGFHPDFTGRENIYFNAAIFGLTKQEINKRLDTIIEFSELGQMPVSSPLPYQKHPDKQHMSSSDHDLRRTWCEEKYQNP